MRKKSKSEIRKVQDQLWEESRQVALKIFANKDGTVDCYTCNAKDLQGSNRQLGHMWAKASLSAILKYDLRILRWQCSRCNIWFGGQGAVFYEKMLKEIGEERMKILRDLKYNPPMVNALDYYKLQLEKTKDITSTTSLWL